MPLSRPHAVIDIGGDSLTAAEAGLVRVDVHLGLDGSHDRADLVLWRGSRFASAAVGDAITVSLGEPDDEEEVLTGEVTHVGVGAARLHIEALAGTVALSRARVVQSYVQQSVADVVNDLAGGADVDEVQGDTQLQAYAVDDRRTAWAHVLELAALTGAEVSAAPGGGLRFVPPRTGLVDHTLRFGAELLSFEVADAAPRATRRFAAHGAASSAGSDRWHWLVRAPSASGDAGPVQIVGGFHNRDAADALAEADTTAVGRSAKRGVVRCVGRPVIRAGDLVELSDLPDGDPGALRVRAVEHVLDATAGFVTTLTVEGAEGGGLLGALGGLL